MCGKNYQAVKESLPSNPKLVFNGPKGVGKTICLLALWQEYIQSSTNAIFLGVHTIKDYLSCYHTNNYLKSLTIDLSNVSEAGDSLNLQIMKYISSNDVVDLSLASAEEEIALKLLKLCVSARVCLVALSSGSGEHFTSNIREKFVKHLECYKGIEFKPFTQDEAIVFVTNIMTTRAHVQSDQGPSREEGIKEGDARVFLKRLKPYARCNPYLLANSLINNNEIPETCASCYTVTR